MLDTCRRLGKCVALDVVLTDVSVAEDAGVLAIESNALTGSLVPVDSFRTAMLLESAVIELVEVVSVDAGSDVKFGDSDN